MSEFNKNDDINTEAGRTDTPLNAETKDKQIPDVSTEATNTADEAESNDTPVNNGKKKNKILSELVDYVEVFAIAISVVILIFSFFFRVCTVDGESMNNTLIHGENLIVSDMFYTPKRGDIIVFHDTGVLDKPVVKRVIATEGQEVTITYLSDTMKVTVTDENGENVVLEEDYILYEYQRYIGTASYKVPEDTVFVMGDNRNDSKDSRDPDIGFVDTRSILGKVIFRMSPFDKIGFVK